MGYIAGGGHTMRSEGLSHGAGGYDKDREVITGDKGSLCKSGLVILSCACYEKQGLIYLMRGLF